MLKMRISLGLALVVAVLTAVVGLTQGVRPLTLLLRISVSLALFGLGSFLLSSLAEAWLKRRLAAANAKGRKIDITDTASTSTDELINPSYTGHQFSPFNPDNFERLSTKE